MHIPHSRRAIGLLAAVVTLVAYADVVFGGRTFLAIGQVAAAYGHPPFSAGYAAPVGGRDEIDPGAESWQVVPWAYAERRALFEGTLPLWNRFAAFGTPLLSNGQTPFFNPVHALTWLSPHSPWLWDLQFLIWRFLAAFFCAVFLLELGARGPFVWMGAIFGALFPAFTVFVSRADQCAFALVPMLLYLLLRLRKSPGPRQAGLFGFGVAFCLAAGHPEPSAAALLFAGTGSLGFLAFPTQAKAAGALLWTAIGGVIGLLLAAPAWLPFFVGLSQKINMHPEGLGSSTRPAFAALQWFIPAAFSHSQMRSLFDLPFESYGFLGGIAGLFFMLALVRLAVVRDVGRYAWTLGAVLLALKFYGLPALSFVGRLPLLSQMLPLYLVPGILFCLGLAGLLAASDLAAMPERLRALCLSISLMAALGLLALARLYVPDGGPGGLSSSWPKQRLLYAVVCVGTAALVFWWNRAGGPHRWAAATLLLLSFGVELSIYRARLPMRGDLYAVAPYVKFLEQQEATQGPAYVMGLGADLFPNASTAWELDDARLCDALFLPRYRTAVETLLNTHLSSSFVFTDATVYSELPKRSLDLLGIRYLVGDAALFKPREPLVAALLRANSKLSLNSWPIGGQVREVLFQHPDDVSVVSWHVAPDKSVLEFSLTQSPDVWAKPGGPVTYSIEADAGAGFVELYRGTIDTRHHPADRDWQPQHIDLSAYAGKEISLRFTAKAADPRFAWGGWGGLSLTQGAAAAQPIAAPLPRVWTDPEMEPSAVFENSAAWARAYLVGQPECASSDAAALKEMQADLAGIGQFAVVEPDFPQASWDSLCAGQCAAGPAGRAMNLEHRTNSVSLEVEADRPAVVVLSEALAPGWRARVDGVEQPIFHANYLFRGVMVGKGHHRISMSYWPREVTWALWLGGAGALAAALLLSQKAPCGRRSEA